MPRINGVNVTQYDNLNINGTIYVGGLELNTATAGNFTDENITNLNGDLIITGKLFIDGSEETAAGGAIPANAKGTRLTNVNILSQMGRDGAPIAF
jgi:hypothetical protein